MATFFLARLLLVMMIFLPTCLAQRCAQPFPGVELMKFGIDLSVYDRQPIVGTQTVGLKAPVIQLTCSTAAKKTLYEKSYDFPDQVWSINTVASGSLSNSVRVYRNLEMVKDTMSSSVGVEGAYGSFAFSSSVSYETMQQSIEERSKELVDVQTHVSSSRIILKTDQTSLEQTIDPILKNYITNNLKESFESDRKAFENFIEQFGTHFYTDANFGGTIRSLMEVDKSYSSSLTDARLKIEASASYTSLLGNLGVSASYGTSTTTKSEKFESSTTKYVNYYGGEPQLLKKDGYTNWQKTVHVKPEIFYGKLKPIYDLIEDESIKQNVKKAVDQHMIRGYLSEIQRQLSTASNYVKHDVLDMLQDKIDAQINKKTLNATEVQMLKSKIEYEVVTPEWFTKYTELCLQYKPQNGGNGQCNSRTASTPAKLCALPNSKTDVYVDRTYYGENGCEMKWGIQSPKAPVWFIGTKICVKWAYRASGGGIIKQGETCSPLNAIEGSFADMSGSINGDYNVMQWKVDLPEDAPLWLKRSKLCYDWTSTSTKSSIKCSAESPQVCAAPGKWTAEYTDRTKSIAMMPSAIEKFFGIPTLYEIGTCSIQWSWNLLSFGTEA